MIVKIIGAWYKGQKQQEERTNPYMNHASSPQDFWRGHPKREINGKKRGKNRARSGTATVLP
jgi:hypothetical protein